MSQHGRAALFFITVVLALVVAAGCGQSWTKVTEFSGGTADSGTSSRSADFPVSGSVRVTLHGGSGSGTIVAYLMPSDAPDDLEGRVDSGLPIGLSGDDGQSVTLENLDGRYYVTATGQFDPWSLTVETAP